MNATASDAASLLRRYLHDSPEARTRLADLAAQLRDEPEGMTLRSNMRGHLTASALILSPGMDEILMIDHLFLKRILPPGGHADGGRELREEAFREAVEETGVEELRSFGPHPLDIDTHPIPANPAKAEGAHVHHDFMFAFVSRTRRTPRHQPDEVSSARWTPVSEAVADPRVRRAVGRLRGNRA